MRSTDVEAAATALHAASLRFILIDEEGEELEEWSNTGETYTPNWVSDIYLSPDGPWLSTDTKGMFLPRMVRAMIDVLVAEAPTPRRRRSHRGTGSGVAQWRDLDHASSVKRCR